MQKIASSRGDVMQQVRQSKASCISMEQLTTVSVCNDFLRRYAKTIKGEKAGAMPFTAESMHFFTVAFQKVGRSNWMLLRNVMPLPHESYLREASRGDHVKEGVKFHEIERSEEHTSELQSLMLISYSVFCLKKN